MTAFAHAGDAIIDADILHANLAAIRLAQPGWTPPEPLDRIRCVNGAWKLFDENHPDGAAIHSRDPHREADRAVSDLLKAGERGVIVAIGLGLGYLLEALDRQEWTGRVLALEPAGRTVQPLLARRDWTAWIRSDRLRILCAPQFDGASDAWRLFDDGSSAPAVYVNPAIANLRPAEVQAARMTLQRIRFNAEANSRARREFGGRYLLNTLANLRALACEGDVAVLTQAAVDRPALVVAAGPSLDENMPAIREAANRALIIAVDTALRPLLHAGVTPHVVVGVDPGETNARHLTELPPCPGTYLVGEASLDPAALETFRGRTFLFSVSNHQPWPWLRERGAGRGALRAWGSVLTSAFDLALRMGCNPIVFAGADLAFTDGRPYCRGNSYEEDWRRATEWGTPLAEQWQHQIDSWPLTEQPDVNGQTTRTAPHLIAFRDWLVEQIAREPAVTFVNGTGRGILTGGGIAQRRLDETVAAWPALQTAPHDLVASRYRPSANHRLLESARQLDRDDATIAAWIAFADGLTRDGILSQLARAVACDRAVADASTPATGRSAVALDSSGLAQIASALPLVALRMPPAQMAAGIASLRRFRFRTTIARVFGSAFQVTDGGVLEDGRPMRRASLLDDIAPGEYIQCRDEIYLVPADGSDPRYNGRTYAVLVPEAVAFAETLPLAEIMARRI